MKVGGPQYKNLKKWMPPGPPFINFLDSQHGVDFSVDNDGHAVHEEYVGDHREGHNVVQVLDRDRRQHWQDGDSYPHSSVQVHAKRRAKYLEKK